MITGADDHDYHQSRLSAGATDFMSKPLNWYLLAQRVRYMWRSSQILGRAKESERLLAQAQMMARIGNWEKNFATGRITTFRQFRNLFGNPDGRRRQFLSPFWTPSRPEQPMVLQAMELASSTGQRPHVRSSRHVGQWRNPKPFATPWKIRRDRRPGHMVSLCGTIQDITKDK
jgi:hypothetical protein